MPKKAGGLRPNPYWQVSNPFGATSARTKLACTSICDHPSRPPKDETTDGGQEIIASLWAAGAPTPAKQSSPPVASTRTVRFAPVFMAKSLLQTLSSELSKRFMATIVGSWPTYHEAN
jgi:hypothetical protein